MDFGLLQEINSGRILVQGRGHAGHRDLGRLAVELHATAAGYASGAIG